ncbi:hypothetical protein EMVG_00325 [Emiliania huxleyi virus PS401]|nr:hypothetical protein EMVG_00325 [Emiliania huxleyi virus PS401]
MRCCSVARGTSVYRLHRERGWPMSDMQALCTSLASLTQPRFYECLKKTRKCLLCALGTKTERSSRRPPAGLPNGQFDVYFSCTIVKREPRGCVS